MKFPDTVTIGHAQVYPARPIPSLHAIHRSLRKRNTGLTKSLHTIACDEDEFFAVCEFLAERRIGGAKPAGKRKGLRGHKAL